MVPTATQSSLLTEPGVRFGVANALLVATFLGCAGFHLSELHTELAALLVTLVACLDLPAAMSALLGLASWAFYTGFVANRYGELTFAHADLVRLALFLGAGAVAAAISNRARLATTPSGGTHE